MSGSDAVPFDVIVVAAGSSRRMGGRDKLDAPIGGRPLLAWTLDALAETPGLDRVIVVTAAGRVAGIREGGWLPPCVAGVVPGGERRQDSVAAGFAALESVAPAGPERVLLVHDGARPLVSPDLVAAVAQAVVAHGAAIPVVPLAETIKRVHGGVVEAPVDRTPLAAAQTPQGAQRGVLREAYRRFPPGDGPTWTDEASLLEACRIPVHAIPGEPGNLKVTLQEDLLVVESALARRGASSEAWGEAPGRGVGSSRGPGEAPRVGFGDDGHPFGPGGPLVLGGITFEAAPRLHGHSDGDVVLHAVADALLGAASLGDLGRIFPPGPGTPLGVASAELLAEVVRRVGGAGFRPASVDVTIVAARPRLAARLDDMRDAVAGIVGLEPGSVSVKASTGNLSGMEGAGRGISARAVAVVEALP